MGICLVSYAIVNAYIVDASDEEDRGKRLAWIHSAFGIGFAVGPFLGSVLVSETIFGTVSFCRPFWVTSLLISINILFVMLYLPETVSSRKKSESGSIQDLFSVERTILFLLLTSFCLCFGWSMYFEFIPVWWIRRFGMSATDVGRYFSWGALWYVVSCTFLVGFLLKRFHAQLLFQRASFLLSLFILSTLFITVPALYYLLLPLQNIFAAFLFPLSALIISERASLEDRGRIMGLQASAEALGFGLSPCLAGSLLGLHLRVPTVVGVMSIVLASILMRSVRKERERAEQLAAP
jgi:DHA1 family tetracycline resistance protein-like MFS transporter